MILITSVLFLGSCGKCKDKDMDSFGYTPQMESYFGVYKNGNWWVYKNQDSTKTDSIYVTDFNEEQLEDRTVCVKYPHRKFNVHSAFLNDSFTVFNCEYNGDGTCCGNYIDCGYLGARVNKDNSIRPIGISQSVQDFFYDTLSVNNKLYRNVIYFITPYSTTSKKIKTYNSPNIGIIKYINTLDTFVLRKYHLQ
jgi:hypothetical protein